MKAEILQLGYKFGFVNDSLVWLTMLKKRNTAVHIYSEEEIDELILLIRNSFIPAFSALEKTLNEKLSEAAVYPMPPRIAPATRAISAAPQYIYLPVKNHRSPFA